MKLNKLYIALIFNAFVLSGLSGQDLHFTQFELAPTLVNPGLAGQFSGTYRVSGVYRDQQRNGGGIDPYQTLSVTADLPVIRGFRKQDWLGAGLTMARDGAGSAGLRMSTFGLNVAYHLGLDKKQTSILSLGVQMTAGSLTFADRDLFFGSVFQSGMPSDVARQFQTNTQNSNGPGGNMGPTRSGSLNDLQVGLVYNARGKTTDFKAGVAVEGILGPDRAYENGTDEKAIGINGFIEYSHANGKRSYLTHRAFYYTQDGGTGINANSRYHYKINPEKDLYVYGGLGTRVFRSVLLFAGVQTGPWRAGLSYDLDIDGSIELTNMHQALELGVSYLGIINKRPKVDPIIYCPRI